MKTETVVENGFKETEIGLMPKSWQVRTVKNTCEKPQYGYTESASDKPIGPKFLRITDITDKRVDWLKVPYCKCPQELINKYKLEKGDILFARIGATTGKSFIVEKCPFAVYASYLIRLRTKTELNPMYLYYFFNSEMYWKQIDAHKGSSLKKGVNGSILASLIFPFPEKPEQQKITFVLSKIQQAIEKQDRIIETTRELKKSLMNKLFTEGLHGEEQKETEIGLIPKRWDVIEVDNLGEIITGTTPPTNNKKYYTGGGFQFISPVDLGDTKYVYKTKKEISLEGLRVSRVLPKDAVLIVCIGSTTGKVGLTFKDKSTTNQQINTVICKDEFNPHFIYYLLNFECNYIRSLSTPSPVPILSKGKFQRAKIPIVKNKQEQDKIAEILSAIDEKIEKAEYRKQTLQALFRTMLNQLIMGKVRVKDFDFEVN